MVSTGALGRYSFVTLRALIELSEQTIPISCNFSDFFSDAAVLGSQIRRPRSVPSMIRFILEISFSTLPTV